MNDNGFVYNLVRAQAAPVDAEALARRLAARASRVARAHASVYTARNGWSDRFPGKPGFFYFTDVDDDRYVIVEAVPTDEGFDILYVGSDVPFAPDGMDGKWKPVPDPEERGAE